MVDGKETPQHTAKDALKAIMDLLNKIGTDKLPKTVVPAGTKNNAGAAAKFFIADVLRTWANKNYDLAKKDAADMGVLGHEPEYVEGTTSITWSSPGFSITVRKSAATTMLDKEKLVAVLTKRYGEKTTHEILKESEKERKGVVTIKPALK